MVLFNINEDTGLVELNKEWLQLIPEFKLLFYNSISTPRTSNVKSLVIASKRFAYIYFLLDFSSPLYNWEESKKKEEALRYSGIKETEAEAKVMLNAIKKYKELQEHQSMALKTYGAVKVAIERLNAHIQDIDFTKVDANDKPIHDPNKFIMSVASINKMYKELKALETTVIDELKANTKIRGSATMGDRELKKGYYPVANEEGSDRTEVTDNQREWVSLTPKNISIE